MTAVSIALASQKCERVYTANSLDHPAVSESPPAVKIQCHFHTTRCENYATAHH
jgi:hypothetical protein